MKSNSKWLVICCVLFMLLSCLPVILIAQLPDGGDPCFGSDPDAYCPVDGGLSLLVAAGIGYGAKKARDNRKKRTAQII